MGVHQTLKIWMSYQYSRQSCDLPLLLLTSFFRLAKSLWRDGREHKTCKRCRSCDLAARAIRFVVGGTRNAAMLPQGLHGFWRIRFTNLLTETSGSIFIHFGTFCTYSIVTIVLRRPSLSSTFDPSPSTHCTPIPSVSRTRPAKSSRIELEDSWSTDFFSLSRLLLLRITNASLWRSLSMMNIPSG